MEYQLIVIGAGPAAPPGHLSRGCAPCCPACAPRHPQRSRGISRQAYKEVSAMYDACILTNQTNNVVYTGVKQKMPWCG